MKIKLYRINADRDVNRVKYSGLSRTMRYQRNPKINSEIYDRVFSGDVECENLNDVYKLFNKAHSRCRGLFVSDITEVIEGEKSTFRFCDLKGFQRVDFDSSKAHTPDNLIRILMIEPNRVPYESEIMNTLDCLQGAVLGDLDCLDNYDGTILVSNADGKYRGLEGNRRMDFDIIAGPFFIAGHGGDMLCSLSDEQVQKYAEMFAVPDNISRAEVEAIRTLSLR